MNQMPILHSVLPRTRSIGAEVNEQWREPLLLLRRAVPFNVQVAADIVYEGMDRPEGIMLNDCGPQIPSYPVTWMEWEDSSPVEYVRFRYWGALVVQEAPPGLDAEEARYSYRIFAKKDHSAKVIMLPAKAEAEARHLNDNALDSRLWNLSWGSARDNSEDRRRNGRSSGGEANSRSKLAASDVRAIRSAYKSGVLQRELAERYGVRPQTISRIVNRKLWRHI
jgi:hypothetical protein